MSGFEVTTAHNVTLRYGYANFWDRFVANLIDNLIKVGYIFFWGFIAMIFFWAKINPDLDSTSAIVGIVILGIVLSLPMIFYSLLFEYFTDGQTPGKRVVKIKVTSLDTDKLTFGKCMIRWLFRLVDFNCYGIVGIVCILVSEKKQRLGDMIAGTVVVSIKENTTINQTIYAQVESDRQARYPQADRLSAREIEIVKEVLRQYDQQGKYDLIPMTATRVRAAINADNEQDDLRFLRTIVQDYNTLAGKD